LNINKVILIGGISRIGRLYHHDDGNSTLEVGLATTKTWTPRSPDDPGKKVTPHRLEVRGVDAVNLARHCVEGQELYVEGELAVREYPKDGETQYVHYVAVKTVQFGRKPAVKGVLGGEVDEPAAALLQPAVPALSPVAAPARPQPGRSLRRQRQPG
jgi:single-stranded DNA-binding protein